MKNPLPGSIADALAGITFPVSDDELKRHVRSRKVAPDIIELIQSLPNKEYNSLGEVLRVLQGDDSTS